MSSTISPETHTLHRVISLPLLVFYGVGVTVGAGIFALTGEITGIVGDNAPLSFLVSGLIAATTAVSYALLTSVYPRAAGEAYFVSQGLGLWPGRLVGIGIVVTAITSSGAIAVAFGNYLGTLVPIPEPVLIATVMVALVLLAIIGVKETLTVAALITLLEVGILVLVVVLGVPLVFEDAQFTRSITPPVSVSGWSPIISGAVIAFFAYLGFEDIVNMGEETIDASTTAPRAIFLTLVITVFIYFCVSLVAVALPDRNALVESAAPLTYMYETLSGQRGGWVSSVASLAMLNGILVQIVMASRVIYGMTRDHNPRAWLAAISKTRGTPVRAIGLVAGLILVIALTMPIVRLAQVTSLILLTVFSLVNFSLWRVGAKANAHPRLKRWRWWGLVALIPTSAVLIIEIGKHLPSMFNGG